MAKRIFDIVGAALGIALLSPLLLAIAALIKATSPGPALHRARRVGLGGRPFTLYKFRTMVFNADRLGPGITGRQDPRITPPGRFLRGAKLDELPQFFNVVKGDMSLVGPRPEDPRYVAMYTPEQREILGVRPGITGVASVTYRHEELMLSGTDPERAYIAEIMPRKLELELAYLKRRSFWSDLGILARTFVEVLR